MNWLAQFLHWLMKDWGIVEPLKTDNETVIQIQPTIPVEAPILPVAKPNAITMTNSEHLYKIASLSLGKDMSPLDKAPDSLACMESVDGVYTAAFGQHLLSPQDRLSTHSGYFAMKKDSRLEAIVTPETGCIVISPTGFSSKNEPHGHTGIWGNNDVMSNDSNSGLWTDNYTHQAWYNVFNKTLGFPVFFFRVKGVYSGIA